MENTFSNSREDVNHWIDTVILSSLRKIHHSPTIGEEFTIEEFVHNVQLCYDIDETQTFAGPVADGVEIVSLQQKKMKLSMCRGL